MTSHTRNQGDYAMTVQAALLMGFSSEADIVMGPYDLSLMVKPDTDFDSRFKAFDVDAGEWIYVNGWLIEDLTVEPFASNSFWMV